MDAALFLGTPRWRLLELIAKNPASPIALAETMKTSVSYVSQQLKLLEAGGFIVKTRTGQAAKGKPRTVYSLAREFVHVSALLHHTPAQQPLYLADHQKIILRLWLLPLGAETIHLLEKIYWDLDSELSEISGIFLTIRGTIPSLTLISTSKIVERKIKTLQVDYKGKLTINLGQAPGDEVSSSQFHVLYDPAFILRRPNEMKGDSTSDE